MVGDQKGGKTFGRTVSSALAQLHGQHVFLLIDLIPETIAGKMGKFRTTTPDVSITAICLPIRHPNKNQISKQDTEPSFDGKSYNRGGQFGGVTVSREIQTEFAKSFGVNALSLNPEYSSENRRPIGAKFS